MKGTNLFWPVYKNMENEFLNIIDYIYCNDEQLEVYSVKISDLIVRCVMEIEAISKQLYRDFPNSELPEGYDKKAEKDGDYPKFDRECLSLLCRVWMLEKKRIVVSSYKCHFRKNENKIFAPLKNAGKGGKNSALWNSAYQAIKHDRVSSFKKGTLKSLIRALGALYILNLYYSDEEILMGESETSFDASLGSNLFSVTYYDATNIDVIRETVKEPQYSTPFNESVYILKVGNDSLVKDLIEAFNLDNQDSIDQIMQSENVRKYILEHIESKDIEVDALPDISGIPIEKRFLANRLIKVYRKFFYSAVVNKHKKIYPGIIDNG